MVCVYCGSRTQVANSRPQKRLHQVWRRRTCTTCGAIFTTNETIDFSTSLVVRNSTGSVQPFNRDQLFVSILRAVGHREAPVRDASALTATITGRLLHNTKTAVITRTDIINTTLQALKHFDQAAAVQYAAYHKPEHADV
jgi:transcriptional repressor NrdR